MDIHRSLIRRCKEGDLQAFDQLVQQIEQGLYQCKIIDWDLSHLSAPEPYTAELGRVRLQAIQHLQAKVPIRESSLGLGDLYNVSSGNLKYASYYTSFLPIPRWLARGTDQYKGKISVISRLVRKGLGK